MENININSIEGLLSPLTIKENLKTNPNIENLIFETRNEISDIINFRSKKMLAIIGPCSIHSKKIAMEYAEKLLRLKEEVSDKVLIIMRVYFEKPRTSVGWKGLIYDPDLDGSNKINKGLCLAREILIDINNIGMGCATEFVDTCTPHFISDLISWAAIGARTTESQIHRCLASGLSMPVGFKNNTAGSISSCVNALKASICKHSFVGINDEGVASIVITKGNPNCHIILRGSKNKPNFEKKYIDEAVELHKKINIERGIIVDCSHGNVSNFKEQKDVLHNLAIQRQNGGDFITGFMMESNLSEGKQQFSINSELAYGQSITDACLSFEDTKKAVYDLCEKL